MERSVITFIQVFLSLALCSGVAYSQKIEDAYDKFSKGYAEEFFLAKDDNYELKMNEYLQLAGRLRLENSKKSRDTFLERIHALDTPPTREQRRRISLEITADYNIAEQKTLSDKKKELFPNDQKTQRRLFQLYEGSMRRLDALDQDIIFWAKDNPNTFVQWQPDFLELTPEQKDAIDDVMKETFVNLGVCINETRDRNPDKVLEEQELAVMLSRELTLEERQDISRKLQTLDVDMLKDAIPQLKKILLQGRENYMRVLNDAQKAKIEAIMAEMPDYMKNLFAEIDKQGGDWGIMHLWHPGMGVPDGPNPNRETPRQRPDRERVFPDGK